MDNPIIVFKTPHGVTAQAQMQGNFDIKNNRVTNWPKSGEILVKFTSEQCAYVHECDEHIDWSYVD